MPTVSEFNGIRIEIRYREDVRHNPHFHAAYGEHEVSYDIVTKEVTGSMPADQLMQIISWAVTHRSQIKKNWYRIKFGKKPIQI